METLTFVSNYYCTNYMINALAHYLDTLTNIQSVSPPVL